MGIKGIYGELGPGERISLARLAAENLTATGRPLRLAIDFSIWQFQARAATGGANPAIRTLFYRCARLLGHGIQAVFVTDGPHKPQMKRNKRSGRGGDAISSAMGRELAGLFGFVWHQAPGEAEAEAALMQQMGLVDAVLTEDVDTIMFGCTQTLRNWSPEGKKTGVPTHVTLYRVDADVDGARGNMNGIDRFGMVLIAMMSGGDYEPEGIPGCGIKIACDAARAGFGRSLCDVRSETPAAFKGWRKDLARELSTNESGFFRSRHAALKIPRTFPNVETLQCYTHPVVSRKANLARAMQGVPWGRDPDVAGLRAFAERTFDWATHTTTVKFVNLLAPSLLVHRLLAAHSVRDPKKGALARAEAEALIHSIGASRTHASADKLPELRVAYVPDEIVKVDEGPVGATRTKMLPFSRDGLAMDGADEDKLGYLSDVPNSGDDEEEEVLPKQDPSRPQLMWMLENILELTAPGALAASREAAAAKGKKGKGRKKKDESVPEKGAMLKYLMATKQASATTKKRVSASSKSPTRRRSKSKTPEPEAVSKPASPKRQGATKAKVVVDMDSDADTDVEEAPTPPKRRGRPPKVRNASDVFRDSDESELDEAKGSPPPPKRRGRSPKLETAPVSETLDNSEGSPRRRGRPPKAKETISISLLSTDEEVSVSPQRRRKKISTTTTTTAENENTAVPATDAQTSPVSSPRQQRKSKSPAVEDVPPSPKRRGRPPKSPANDAVTLPLESEPEPPTKRRKSSASSAASLNDLPSLSHTLKLSRSKTATTTEIPSTQARKSKQLPLEGLFSARQTTTATTTSTSVPSSQPPPPPPPPSFPARSHSVCPRTAPQGDQYGSSAADAIHVPSSPAPADRDPVAIKTASTAAPHFRAFCVGAAAAAGPFAPVHGEAAPRRVGGAAKAGRQAVRRKKSGGGLLAGQKSIRDFAAVTKRVDGEMGKGRGGGGGGGGIEGDASVSGNRESGSNEWSLWDQNWSRLERMKFCGEPDGGPIDGDNYDDDDDDDDLPALTQPLVIKKRRHQTMTTNLMPPPPPPRRPTSSSPPPATKTPKINPTPPSPKLTRLMLPRMDPSGLGLGFGDTVRVTAAEAAVLEAEHRRRGRAVVRVSDVSIMDLVDLVDLGGDVEG